MTELAQRLHQLKRDDFSEAGIAWQQIAGLEEGAFSGSEVAQAGLVPVLVALLEQAPCPSRAEVQDQAACLLLEAAASDLGMEELLRLNCVTQLTAALLSGSCVKRARVIAILGMISISTQDQQKPDHLIQYCQTMMVLAVSSVPEVVTVLSQSASADAASLAMMLRGLEALLQGPVPVKCLVQAGALEVFAMLLTSLPHQQADTLLSSCAHNDDSDDDSDDDSESAVIEEMWSAAVGILSQVVIHNPEGSKQIMQGPLLLVLMQCCNTSSVEVQQLTLAILNSLATVPEHLPAFSRAEGHMHQLALATRSPSRLVQTQGLTLIKVIAPFFGHAAEQMLVKALEGLPCNAMYATTQHESSDSSKHMA